MGNPYSQKPVSVSVLGEVLSAETDTAYPWLRSVTKTGGVLGILTGVLSRDRALWMIEAVLDNRVTPQEAATAAEELLTQAVPYTWWKTVRLLALSCREDVCGHLTLAGLDPHSVTVAQWCHAVYVLLTRDSDTKARFKIDVALDDPPAGVEHDVVMSDDEFDAMVAAARSMPGQT